MKQIRFLHPNRKKPCILSEYRVFYAAHEGAGYQ